MPARNLRACLDDEEPPVHDAVTRYIDGAAIEDREFLVVAGLGFDAATARDAYPNDGRTRCGRWPGDCDQNPRRGS
jgi:hypothetical protein